MRVRVARLAGALICVAAMIFGLPIQVGASTVLYRTDAELVALSERIVHGRVLRQRFERPDPRGPIYTVTTLAVLEDLTGVPGATVEVWELGGVYGDEIMFVGGAVHYAIGEEVLVFLERGRRGLRSTAMGFSRFTVQRTASRDGLPDGQLIRGMHDTVVWGAPAQLPRERSLAEFRALARQVRGRAPIRNEAAERMQPEERVSANYTLLLFGNGLSPRWTQADSGTPVMWYRNSDNPAPLQSGNSDSEIQTALAAWTNPPSASIILQLGGTTTFDHTNAPTGTGVIIYEDPHNEIDDGGSVLAIGGGWASFGGGGTVNGTNFNRFTRGYVIFQNAGRLCTFSGGSFCQSTNFTRVLQHEIGHAIGFGHTQIDGTVPNATSNIMYPSCCSSSTPLPPALGPDDLAVLEFVYPTDTGGGCTYSLSPSSVLVGNSAVSSSFQVVTQSGCAWTAATNAPSFLTVTGGASGTGTGLVLYSVAANTGPARSGTITAGGQTFTVNQNAGPSCSYTLTPSSANLSPGGGSGSFTVTTGAGCEWTAVSNNGFITVTGGAAGTGSGTVNYSVSANGLSARSGTITAGGQTFTINQSGTGPTMSVSRSSLYFGATHTGTTLAAKTSGQTFRITQSGAGTVTWTASSNQPWLTVTPTSGTAPSTLTVNVQHHPSLPVQGTATGAITLSFTGAGTTAGPVTVTLTTKIAGTSSAPIGSFDTPTDQATGISGSIAVTGWALDDVEVTSVRIVRSTVLGTCVNPIPIGTATFVDGARPDIAGFFPTTPRNTRGGWGYMMLTNFLPNIGNGTFTLCAIADDAEGGSSILDVRTITLDNATATKPFGAIDTPTQGGTISGTSFTNFGWVLSRAPGRADPPGGGTVTVYIDGAPVGSPSGWTSRPDLTSLFPAAQYPGIATAAGAFTFNPQNYSEGVYSIAWAVTNNLGQSDGIGSRYFTVTSGGALEAGVVEEAAAAVVEPRRVSGRTLVEDVNAAPRAPDAIRARRGYDLDTPLRVARADRDGRAFIDGEELDRFELRLRPGLAGYLRTGDGLSALPIGSNLDPATGTFTWQPGVGFIGRYDLVFVEWADGRAVSRQEVTITLHPRGSNRVGPQVVIDTPAFGAVVPGAGRQIRIGGWAVDLDDAAGTGVSTLHVWAYPVDPQTGLGGGVTTPTFLGATTYGGARPDVAAVFGEQYLNSGYDLVTGGLAPGTYDIAVFAWSTVRGGFVPAKVVRVHVW